MQLLNDPEKEVYNGDLGVVREVIEGGGLTAEFPHPTAEDKVNLLTYKVHF